MITPEDKKDVSRAFGKSAANKVARATDDSKSKALHAKMGKTKYYVGHSNEPHKREVFGSKVSPTKESHPQYGHVRSGFKSKKDAESRKDYY